MISSTRSVSFAVYRRSQVSKSEPHDEKVKMPLAPTQKGHSASPAAFPTTLVRLTVEPRAVAPQLARLAGAVGGGGDKGGWGGGVGGGGTGLERGGYGGGEGGGGEGGGRRAPSPVERSAKKVSSRR